MGYLRKGLGKFDLSDTDRFCGSFISMDDTMEIYGVRRSELNHLPFIDGFIDELDLHKNKESITTIRGSLDTFILEVLIRRMFPTVDVEQKARCGRNIVDLRVKTPTEEFYIDFLSPHDFDMAYGKMPMNPIDKRHLIEDKTGKTCFQWPYWIQRCSGNLYILLNHSKNKGWGALWSTNFFFGNFPFPNSAAIIEELTNPFNAMHDDGLGYILEGWNAPDKQKPEHPIIREILSGRKDRSLLIPRGSKDDAMWLPVVLR